MKTLFAILFFIFSNNTFAQGFKTIKHPHNVFIRQMTPVWCWAATAEALHNYSNPEIKSQEIIANENPNAFDKTVYTKVEPYFMGDIIDPYIPMARVVKFKPEEDYLLSQVLGSKTHKAQFGLFDGEKVRELIDNDQPVILNYNAHMMMIFGYFDVGGHYFYYIYDPNSLNLGTNPIYYYAESEFDWLSWNIFAQDYNYFGLAKIIYLEKRKG